MELFYVFRETKISFDIFLGAFSTEEKAEEYIQKQIKESNYVYDRYDYYIANGKIDTADWDK